MDDSGLLGLAGSTVSSRSIDSSNDPYGSIGYGNSSSSASRVSEREAIAKDPNSALYDLYKTSGDRAYLEKYIDNLMAEKSVNDARAFQKMQDDTQYSRAMKDIEKAGYNPWLLLQGSVATAGSGNFSAASYSKNSASEAAASRLNTREIAEENNKTKVIVGLIAAAALIAKILI